MRVNIDDAHMCMYVSPHNSYIEIFGNTMYPALSHKIASE